LFLKPARCFFKLHVVNSLSNVIQNAKAIWIAVDELVRRFGTVDDMRAAKVETSCSKEMID